jgi:hypothetical protein
MNTTKQYNRGQRISSQFFHYDRVRKQFDAEISTLAGNRINILAPLYTMTIAGKGFIMVSAKSKKEVPFLMVEILKDGEGETIGWKFKPTDAAISDSPELKGVTVVVDND